MKLIALGIVAGLILAWPLTRFLIWWSEHNLPKPVHQGVKWLRWENGVLVAGGNT